MQSRNRALDPIVSDHAQNGPAGPDTPPGRFPRRNEMEGKNILIIEDNTLNMKLVRSILNLNHFLVMEASNAEDGIRLAREKNPDAILMDIQLPGMDGLSATKLISNDPDLKHIPVIALTSYAMRGDKKEAMKVGCKGYITKPINQKLFMAELNRILKKPDAEPAPSQSGGHLPRVLIVDDEPQNLKLFRAYLMQENFEVTTADNGIQCLKMVSSTWPDLILLDVMMPELSGFEVTWKLKNDPKTNHIPIVLLTALDSSEARNKGLEAGADEFLTKPVNRAELLARVNSMLRLKKYQDQLTTRTRSEEHFVQVLVPESARIEEKNSPRVLIVEDNDSDFKLMTNYLIDQPYELLRAENGEAAVNMALKHKVDLILLDVMLPGMNGFEVCRKIKENSDTRHIQIVIISCLDDLDSRIMGVETGADEYLIKPINIREIQARVKALLRKKSYMDQICSHYEVALNSAITDGLTGLYNQTYFTRYLDLEMKRCIRQKYPLALLMIDIDNFKIYNDELGHLVGDVLLREVAQIIRANVREIDLVARYGGDEFAVVLPYSERAAAIMVAERICASLNEHEFSATSINNLRKVSASIGVAVCPEDACSVPGLIEKSDGLMFSSKKDKKKSAQIPGHA